MVAQRQLSYQYTLDKADVFVAINSWWLAFAQENGAAELCESNVIGRPLWSFIEDAPTRTLYREIHEHVRASGSPVKLPFRCDSPTLKRYMSLRISRGTDGDLLYVSTLQRAVPQDRVALLDPHQNRSKAILTMCSFCKRSLVETSGWMEMENISLNLSMYRDLTVPQLRYTVCPTCADQSNAERN
jgi:hypothetical protein